MTQATHEDVPEIQKPLTLRPTANWPATTIDASFWRRAKFDDEDLYNALTLLLEENEPRVNLVMKALDRELPTEDGHTLARAVAWLDSQVTFMNRLLFDAEALLDIAEGHFAIPAGRAEIVTDDEGKLIPSDCKGWSEDTEAMDEEARKKFKPKWNVLTTNDREVDCAAKCVAFRRLRNEYQAIIKGLESKLYKASDLLGLLRAEYRAAGPAERRR